MDAFENNPCPNGDQPTRPASPEAGSAYPGPPPRRKESPYANSPYMMPGQAWQAPETAPRQTWQQPQPVQQPWQTAPQQPQQAEEPQQPVREEPEVRQQAPYQRTYYYQPEQDPAERPQKPKAPRKSGKGVWKRVLAVVLALVVVAGSCAITAGVVNSGWQRRASRMETDFNEKLEQLQTQLDSVSQKADQQIALGTLADGALMTPAQVYARNVDAVVMVYSTVVYYSYGQQSTGTSTGSGFFISQDGYILTNYHVIEGATAVSIITHGGEEYEAAIIGSDSTNDVALLKIEGQNLPYAALGSSNDLTVGDQVVAIGNPLGELTSTMTVGYVSGKERSVTTDGTTIDMIQTDAAINSGNSGGPLFNMKGEVVGITTAKYSGESASGASIEGIGFAIPMDDVMEVVADLLEYGYVKSAYMGITVLDMDASVASMYNLPAGVYVQSVEPDGPAAAAGMQAEDIIISLDGKTITNYNDLARALRELEPGDVTTVVVFRSGLERQLTITLGERPNTGSTPESNQPENEMPSEGSYEDWYKYFEPFFDKDKNGD